MEAILPQSRGSERRRHCHNEQANSSKEDNGLTGAIGELILADSEPQCSVNEEHEESNKAGAPGTNSNPVNATM